MPWDVGADVPSLSLNPPHDCQILRIVELESGSLIKCYMSACSFLELVTQTAGLRGL